MRGLRCFPGRFRVGPLHAMHPDFHKVFHSRSARFSRVHLALRGEDRGDKREVPDRDREVQRGRVGIDVVAQVPAVDLALDRVRENPSDSIRGREEKLANNVRPLQTSEDRDPNEAGIEPIKEFEHRFFKPALEVLIDVQDSRELLVRDAATLRRLVQCRLEEFFF